MAANRGSCGSMQPTSSAFVRQQGDLHSAKGVRMHDLEDLGSFFVEEFRNWIMSFRRR